MGVEIKLKIKKSSEDNWDILLDDKIVGRIEQSHGYVGKSGIKRLYIGEKSICRVDNQKDAINKLEEFFLKNKEEIKSVEKQIGELTTGITQVSHQICVDTLKKERDKLNQSLAVLRSYDLN